MSVQASCPACGAPVPFKVGSSLVVVCAHCRSLVARGDRGLEDLGKVADVTDTGAILELWLKGRWQGVPFDLVGRAQLGHESGGVWDEWYAAFADGRWGWLAEAQGRFYLTFRHEVAAAAISPFKDLHVGHRQRLPGLGLDMTIIEKRKARLIGAQGEIPWRIDPGATYAYADLSGPDGAFATLDYSESSPLLYLGKETSLDELGIAKPTRLREREAKPVAGVQLNCPQCGGPLALRAPDKAERVACPNCRALLDVNEGKLKLLKSLDGPKLEPAIPLGAVGRVGEGEFQAIGFLQRSVTFDGMEYFWEEYLLHEPSLGFRWLVRSDHHWNYVRPVSADDAKKLMTGGSGLWQYKAFQRAHARVTYVAGEFYWKVEQGERVHVSDFIRPPSILSCEKTEEEVNWSRGEYLPRQEVEKAFGLKPLPSPSTIAPNQPFPFWNVYLWWGVLLAAACLLALLFATLGSGRKVFEQSWPLSAKAATAPETREVLFGEPPFELLPRRNIEIAMQTSADNAGVHVEGELVELKTGTAHPFGATAGRHSGVEDGESWSEGSNLAETHLSAVPGGEYTIRLDIDREKPTVATIVTVRVRQGVPRWKYFLYVLLAVSAIPLGVLLYHWYFETQRWKDSNCVDKADSSDE